MFVQAMRLKLKRDDTSKDQLGLLWHIFNQFPNLNEFLENMNFDRATIAPSQRYIIPRAGFLPEYDALQIRLENALESINDFHLGEKSRLRSSQLRLTRENSGPHLFVANHSSLTLPPDYNLISSTKSIDTFSCLELERLSNEIQAIEKEIEVFCSNLIYHYLGLLESHNELLDSAIQCVAALDVLLSLSLYALNSPYPMCRPVLISTTDGQRPLFKARQMYHPFMRPYSGDEFIPNDVDLGGDSSQLMLITGPNMGGKSTLLRQCCLILIMAQIGSLVPAASCELTVVDQIFTRLGAKDRIFAGQSTFMVELVETSQMLHKATANSFVVMDELGRGTSTFDGYSIAHAVLKQLETLGCRALFATHYHLLTEEFLLSQSVSMAHLACKALPNGTMSFLYRLAAGMQVARMANLSSTIVERATNQSEMLESAVLSRHGSRVVRRVTAVLRNPSLAKLLWTRLKQEDITLRGSE